MPFFVLLCIYAVIYHLLSINTELITLNGGSDYQILASIITGHLTSACAAFAIKWMWENRLPEGGEDD